MNRLKGLLLSCLSVVVALTATANTSSSDTLFLTLDKAIEIALSDNPTIKIADHEIERVDYAKKGAAYNFIPTISATGNFAYNIQKQVMSMGGMDIEVGQDLSISGGLSLSLPLIVPSLFTSMKMSGLEMDLALEKARSSKINMRFDVTKAYFNVLLAQDAYLAIQDGYDIAKQNFEEASHKFSIGAVAEYDAVSAEVQMRSLLPNLVQAETAVKQSKLYFKVLLGLDMSTEIALDGKLQDYENDVQPVAQEGNVSLSNNSDLIQLDIQQQQFEKQLNMQRNQRLPSLVAFGNFQYAGMGNIKEQEPNPMFGQTKPIPAGVNWFPTTAVGVQLNVPIFTGLTHLNKQKQMKVTVKELDLQKDYLKSNLNVQVEGIINNMKQAVEQIESNKESVRLAEKSYQISKSRYDSGMGTFIELRSAALSVTQSKLSYSQAISDYLVAKAEYEKILGK